MNQVFVTGRLTGDPEVRYTQNGIAVTQFDIAVDDGYGDKKRTDFFRVVAWRKLAEMIGNNLTKGRKVLIVGKLHNRSYENKDGQKRRVTEITADNVEFMDYKKDGQNSGGNAAGGNNSGYDVNSFGTEVFPEEEIPF